MIYLICKDMSLKNYDNNIKCMRKCSQVIKGNNRLQNNMYHKIQVFFKRYREINDDWIDRWKEGREHTGRREKRY